MQKEEHVFSLRIHRLNDDNSGERPLLFTYSRFGHSEQGESYLSQPHYIRPGCSYVIFFFYMSIVLA